MAERCFVLTWALGSLLVEGERQRLQVRLEGERLQFQDRQGGPRLQVLARFRGCSFSTGRRGVEATGNRETWWKT